MTNETRKIMHLPDLPISATCVRVPVMVAHAEAAHIEFEHSISPGEAREVLDAAPGITVLDGPRIVRISDACRRGGQGRRLRGTHPAGRVYDQRHSAVAGERQPEERRRNQRDSDRRGGVATGPSARQNLKPNPYPMAQMPTP